MKFEDLALLVEADEVGFPINQQPQDQRLYAHRATTDGIEEEKEFSGPNAKEELKEYIDKWVGLDGEISNTYNYIVSRDGVCRIAVRGIRIRELLGREPRLKLDPGYMESLMGSALKVFAPSLAKCKELHKSKDYEDGACENLSYTLRWKQLTHNPTEEHIWDPTKRANVYRKRKYDLWELLFTSYLDKEKSSVSVHLCIFYLTVRDHRVGVIDGNDLKFELTGNHHEDLAKLEPLFKNAEEAISKIPFDNLQTWSNITQIL